MAGDVRLTALAWLVVAVLVGLIVVPMPGEQPRDPTLADAPEDDFAYWQALRRRDGLPEAPDPLLQATTKPKKPRAAKQTRKPPPPPPVPPPEKPKATKPKKATAAAKAAAPTPVAECRARDAGRRVQVTLEPREQPILWRIRGGGCRGFADGRAGAQLKEALPARRALAHHEHKHISFSFHYGGASRHTPPRPCSISQSSAAVARLSERRRAPGWRVIRARPDERCR